MNLYSDQMFEMDEVISGPDVIGGQQLFRGCFPSSVLWKCIRRPYLREVRGSFKNLTDLDVPEEVRCILSYGPKFMMPAFTLMSPVIEEETWEILLAKLRMSSYYLDYDIPSRKQLKLYYDRHSGGRVPVKRIAWRVMRAATSTADFLQLHHKYAVIVEGDKGKSIGLMERCHYAELITRFITTGLAAGNVNS